MSPPPRRRLAGTRAALPFPVLRWAIIAPVLSRGDVHFIEDEIKTAPRDGVLTQVIKYIFGEAIAGNAEILEGMLLAPSMTATDDTMSAQQAKWRARCEAFVQQEFDRDVRIQADLQLQTQSRLTAQNAVTPLQYAMAVRTYNQTAQAIANEEYQKQQNDTARKWCELIEPTLSGTSRK